MADALVVITLVSNTDTNLILAAGHAAARPPWQKFWRSKDLDSVLKTLLSQAWARSQSLLTRPSQASDSDALQISLTVDQNSTRMDAGSDYCLNLLLSQQLIEQGFKVVRTVGNETITLIHHISSPTSRQARATLNLATWWQRPKNKRLPLNLTLNGRWTAAVFAQTLDAAYHGTWPLEFRAGDLVFTPDPTFLKTLNDQRTTLLRNDWPHIAAVNRAWVYLDRGRAWGLKLKDRVVIVGSDKPIKGHVVSFFGPEKGLISPRGFPIQEGAIVYVRKDQDATQVGQEVHFDPQTYPTPWPPQASSGG